MKIYDVAAGPMIAIPIAVGVAILAGIGLIVLAIVLIVKSHKKK